MQINKTIALSLLAAWATQLTMAAKKQRAKADTSRPNVIMIVADDLGYGDLECYGAKNVETPNVNRLAAEGVRFTDCHAAASTSTPSRYSLLTGEYPWRRPGTDVAPGNAAMIIKPEQFTIADMFRSQGYATCAIGKWHLGLGDRTGEQDWNAPLPASPADIGFDNHYIMAATADRVPCVIIEDGMVANYDESAPIDVNYYHNFEGEPTAREHPELCYNLRSSHGHDQAIVNGIGRIGYMKGGGKALWKDENIADSITGYAVNYIKQHADRPFFMYFATNDVHVPRFPHERFRGKSGMGLRGDAIVQFDWSVGEIMRTLERLGIADNTIILLTSDNGPVTDDGYVDRADELLNGHSPQGPWRSGKYSAYEGGTAVPVIVRWKAGGVKAGATSEALFSHIDLLASFGSLINARIPKGAAVDSENRISTLLGNDRTDRPYVIGMANNHVLSVRTKQWKYIEPNDGAKTLGWAATLNGERVETGNSPQPQLYDMQKDIKEEHNVALENAQTVFDLQNVLRRERAK